MIIDHRTYTLHPGKVPDYLRLYEAEGMAVQTRILGRMLGYFVTETGPQNQVVHMWGYESMEDRSRRRAELFKDQDWLAYVAKIRPLLVKQKNKILTPAAFSPIR